MIEILDQAAAVFDVQPWSRPFAAVVDVSSEDLERWLAPQGLATSEPAALVFGSLARDASDSRATAASGVGRRAPTKKKKGAGAGPASMFDTFQRQD